MNIIDIQTLPAIGDMIWFRGNQYKVMHHLRTVNHLTQKGLQKSRIHTTTSFGVGVAIDVYFKLS